MATAGTKFTAADFNSVHNIVTSLYGFGFGDIGYGQATLSASAVSVNQLGTAAQWNALKDIMSVLGGHQGTSVAAMPTFSTSERHSAAKVNTMTSIATGLFNARFSVASGEAALSSNAYTNTRGADWSGTITSSFDVGWANENFARYFFNSGGQIHLRFSHPSITGHDADWSSILSRVGTVVVSAHSCAGTGSLAVANLGGYYAMNGNNQMLVDGTNAGSGAYDLNDFYVHMQRVGFSGANGGNGSGIRFTVTLTADTGSVSGGTTVAVDVLRSVNAVVAPATFISLVGGF